MADDPARRDPEGDRMQAVLRLADLIMSSDDLFMFVDETGAIVHANHSEPDPKNVLVAVLEKMSAAGRDVATWRGTIDVETSGRTRTFDVQATRGDGSTAIHARDITAFVLERRHLVHLATHDALTELPNRSLLLSSLADSIERAHARRTNVAVLYVDIDDLKRINDSVGHDLGDAVIAEIGRRLSTATRPGDLVARIGGDEFVVLCEGVEDERSATDIAERVRLAATGPMTTSNLDTSVSVGVVLYTGHDARQPIIEVAQSLLREADKAMYDAKAHGKSQCWVHQDT